MTTKLELTQLLATRNTELEAARLRISTLEGELALRPRPSQPTMARLAYLARTTDKAPSDFALRCMAAKAAAMTSGAAVRV